MQTVISIRSRITFNGDLAFLFGDKGDKIRLKFLFSSILYFSLLLVYPHTGITQAQVVPSCGGPVVCIITWPEAGTEPKINDTELIYRVYGPAIVSSTRGFIATGHSADINGAGEVVYVTEDDNGIEQVFSTERDQLTFVDSYLGARTPTINSLGEVVYASGDEFNQLQIFSNVRGQLTFFVSGTGNVSGDPTIDDSGRVVFEVNMSENRANLWEIDSIGNVNQLTFYDYPLHAGQPTLAAETGELVYLLKDQTQDELSLISERDGEIFSGGIAVGPGIGTFPDLSPSGFLVFQTQDDNLTGYPGIVVRASDSNGNQCSFNNATCPVPPEPVSMDIKPKTCLNEYPIKGGGSIEVAVHGTVDFDATDIDATSVRLEGVDPTRSSLKDKSTPASSGGECPCTNEGRDDFIDLCLKFDKKAIITAIETELGGDVELDTEYPLTLSGVLNDGTTPIEGEDCITFVKKGKKH